MGAWIEMSTNEQMLSRFTVAPLVGAWIEIWMKWMQVFRKY